MHFTPFPLVDDSPLRPRSRRMSRHGATRRVDGRIFQVSGCHDESWTAAPICAKARVPLNLSNSSADRFMSVQETALPLRADDARFAAIRLARGVCRALAEHGYSVLTEFPLQKTGRASWRARGRQYV